MHSLKIIYLFFIYFLNISLNNLSMEPACLNKNFNFRKSALQQLHFSDVNLGFLKLKIIICNK